MKFTFYYNINTPLTTDINCEIITCQNFQSHETCIMLPVFLVTGHP